MPTGVYIAIGFVCLLAALVFVARNWGKSSTTADIAEHTAKRQRMVIEAANEVEREVDRLSDDDVSKRLSKWSRD